MLILVDETDRTDEETAALVRLLSDTIDGDRFALSPRVLVPKAILDKIKLPVRLASKPPPVSKPGDRSRAALAAMKRRRRG
jgi:hypothetical protein